MEYPIFHTQKSLQNVPKVIKVVNLKRFMPEAHLETTPKSKRRNNPVVNHKAIIDIGSQNKLNTGHENSIVGIIEKPSGVEEYIENHNTKMLSLNGRNIHFRNCSHTLEELSTFHECVDDTLVKVGDIFESRESFKKYLNDNAKRWHYYYVCRNSKEKIIEYNCICMAYSTKQREVVIRKQKKRTTACPCKIRLTINDTSKLIVYYVCNHHDHPTTASAFHNYPHAKYLPQHVKEEFLDLTYLGLNVDLIQKYVHSAVGLTIKKKDIWSYAYRFKRKIFKRSISKERRIYMEGLITKIRETYGESLDTKQQEMPSEHSEVVLSIKEVEFRQNKSINFKKKDPVSETLTDNLNYSEELLKVLGDASIDTEVIVQYINEEGILCDENGIPVTTSSAIMQFINNYAYASQELHQTVHSELDIGEQVYSVDWEADNVVCESEPCVEGTEGADLNDVAELMGGEVGTENLECIGTAESDSNEKRLSPTPDTPAVYAEMENFRKYYYVDHRYIPYENQKCKGTRVPRDSDVCYSSGAESSTLAREEFIKAPDFVYHPSPIRHCTGHDHLTLLTDVDAIYPGAKFLTHDVFLTYINERANRWFFYYSMMESGKAPENYVYKCVYGKTRVSKNAYRAKGLRKRNKLTTQCPCQIRLRRLEADPTYLTVLYSCNHHDHDLDSRQFNEQPHSRRLPSVVKEEIKDLITLGVGAEVLRKHVFAETGVLVYGKYFHNVRAGMRARGEQRQYSEGRLQTLTKKIRDLESIYGNAAKEAPQSNLAQHQPKQRTLPLLPIGKEDRFTQAGWEETGTQTREYCELSDRDDFAEEVCIVQDTLPTEDAAKQSRLETRLQNLSHKEILSKVIDK